MKVIRRSLNKDRISPPSAVLPPNGNHATLTSASTGPLSCPTQPFASLSLTGARANPASLKSAPSKVIRALFSYRARRVTELNFEKGDFFHVEAEREDQEGEWFEASNPATGARGLVPRRCFQILGRSAKDQPGRAGEASKGQRGVPSMLNLSQAPKSGGGLKSAGSGQGGFPVTSGSGVSIVVPPMPNQGVQTPGSGGPKTPKSQPLYGIVQYDFVAERADELDAKRGEPIIVIAQSNHEWFVAKPIGRLGGPGLIPVAFVEVQDVSTGKAMPPEKVEELIRSAVVPKVEEWKKATAAYKGNSIPLGRFDFASVPGGSSPSGQQPLGTQSLPARNPGAVAPTQPQSPLESAGLVPVSHTRQQSAGGRQVTSGYEGWDRERGVSEYAMGQMSSSTPAFGGGADERAAASQSMSSAPEPAEGDGDGYATVDELRERYGVVVHASVESFHYEQNYYWFHLRAHFTRPSPSDPSVDEMTVLVLYRLYEDFYEFQIALMNTFPREAGRAPEGWQGPPPKRILPMMPGPSNHVDNLVCAQRVQDLSFYLAELCQLPAYIRESELVYEFLGPREGDVELEGDPSALVAQQSASVTSEMTRGSAVMSSETTRGDPEGEVVEYLDRMSPTTRTQAERDAARGIEATASARTSTADRDSYSNGQNGYGRGYASGGSISSQGYATQARKERERERLPSIATGSNGGEYATASSSTSSHRSPTYGPMSASTDRPPSTVPSSTHSSGSQSKAGAPPASTASSQQTSFIRIKIFQRRTDDLIAIRVPTNVSHAQLLERIRERIGDNVDRMRYRDEEGTGYSTGGSTTIPAANGGKLVALDNDDDLQRWLNGSNRMVLYAD